MAKLKVGCVAVVEYPAESDSFILVEETKEHKKGRLNLPGGGLNYNKDDKKWETPFECVEREFPEETGLEVELVGYLGSFFYVSAGQIHHGFAGRVTGGQLSTQDKHPTVESYPYGVIEDVLVPEGHLRSSRVISLIQQFRNGEIFPLDSIRIDDEDTLPQSQYDPRLEVLHPLAA